MAIIAFTIFESPFLKKNKTTMKQLLSASTGRKGKSNKKPKGKLTDKLKIFLQDIFTFLPGKILAVLVALSIFSNLRSTSSLENTVKPILVDAYTINADVALQESIITQDTTFLQTSAIIME